MGSAIKKTSTPPPASFLRLAEEKNRRSCCADSLEVPDYADREIVRSRLRRHLLEVANVLAGTYDGQENVELGKWASGATEQTLHQHAAEFLTLHKSVFS